MKAGGADLALLGRREDQRLEFKAGEVLADPEKVAREVVGMLNAQAGEVWIGVAEADGVAARIEPVEQAARARDRLLDVLLETLEPSPTAEEVRIELVPEDAERALLRVVVTPRPGRRPYALLRKGGRHFLKRVGARLHPMSREEWLGAGREELGREEGREEARERRIEAARAWLGKERLKQQVEACEGLWLGIAPAVGVDVDLDRTDFFEAIVTDPGVTNNQRGGWSFHQSSSRPVPFKDGIEWRRPLHSLSRIFESGEMTFYAQASSVGSDQELAPFPLLQYPVSAFRIAKAMYETFGVAREAQILADLALLGIAGLGLRPGSPRSMIFLTTEPKTQHEPDLVWEPLAFTAQEIFDNPDRCALHFIRRIYRAFGLRAEDIPREFDQERGRLILPE